MDYDDQENQLQLFDNVEEPEDDDPKKILTIEIQTLDGKDLPKGEL